MKFNASYLGFRISYLFSPISTSLDMICNLSHKIIGNVLSFRRFFIFLIIRNFVGIKLLPEYKNRHVTSARVEPPGQTDFKFAFRGWASPPPNPWPLASVWREHFLHQQSCHNPITFAFMIRLISLLISIPRNTNHQIHVKKEIKDMKILSCSRSEGPFPTFETPAPRQC